jgi:hypothetical protein
MDRTKVPIGDVKKLILRETDEAILNAAKERQAAVWEGLEPDYLPLVVYGTIPEQSKYPAYDMREMFFDPEKMLYGQMWSALQILRGKSDAVPSVRVNFGTGFLASVFGLEQEISTDKMPWLKKHLTKEEILGLEPTSLEPIQEKGLIPKWCKYVSIYRRHLSGTSLHIYLPDTQGMFDLAHLVAGDAIFTEIYDDNDFIRHLFSLAGYVYQKASSFMKSFICEPLQSGYHCVLYTPNAGVRSCEDTTTLLSPKLLDSVLPYLRESVRPFGAWFHFCGDGNHLVERLLSLPETKGINFGNPEKYDWPEVFSVISSYGKVYYGTVKRKEKESLPEYFERVLEPLSRKGNLIFAPELQEGEEALKAIEVWRKVQDRKFDKHPHVFMERRNDTA